MSVQDYANIRFSFADIERELTNIESVLSSHFFDRSFRDALAPWRTSLLSARSRREQARWELSPDKPLRTKCSEGKSHPRGGAERVFAEVSSVWEIVADMPAAKKAKASHFHLVGKASTKVCIHRCEDKKLIAVWTFDIGSHDSPGCHFHTQVPWCDLVAGATKLDVPRLPSLIATPFDAIEFVLAELFQEEWPLFADKNANRLTDGDKRRRRLQSLLRWKLNALSDYSGYAPVTHLKKLKPQSGSQLF